MSLQLTRNTRTAVGRTAFVALIALAVPHLSHGPLAAQPVPLTVRGYFIWNAASHMARAIAAVAQYGETKRTVEYNVATARDRFWQQYPDGPELEAARTEYAHALFLSELLEADRLVLSTQMANARLAGFEGIADRGAELASAVERMTGGVAESVHPFARPEFRKWVSDLVAYRRQGKTLEEAFRASMDEYGKFADMRDRAEYLFRSNKSPLRSANLTEKLTGVLLTCKPTRFSDAVQEASGMVAAIQEPQVLQTLATEAADYLRGYNYANSAASTSGDPKRCPVGGVLYLPLTERSTKAFAIELLKGSQNISWSEASAILSDWERRFGVDKVIAATERMKRAETERARRNESSLASLCPDSWAARCLGKLLGADIARSYSAEKAAADFRASSAKLDRTAMRKIVVDLIVEAGASPDQADARYRRLVSWFDESLLLTAVQQVNVEKVAAETKARTDQYRSSVLVYRWMNALGAAGTGSGMERAFLLHSLPSPRDVLTRGSEGLSIQHVEAAEIQYRDLLQRFGEPRLLEAASRVSGTYMVFEGRAYKGQDQPHSDLLKELGVVASAQPVGVNYQQAAPTPVSSPIPTQLPQPAPVAPTSRRGRN